MLATMAAAAAGLGRFGWRGGGAMPAIGPARSDAESWRALLAGLSALAIAGPGMRPRPTAAQRSWPGEPPAEEGEIAATEARLGIRLRASHRGVLRVSNGWHFPSSFVGPIRPVARLAPFVEENRDRALIHAGIGDRVACHVLATLQLSRRDHEAGDDGAMLLAPAAPSVIGEAEAWLFANGVPGANVHPSFWRVMAAERHSLRFIASRRP
jgi:hypothetical protein